MIQERLHSILDKLRQVPIPKFDKSKLSGSQYLALRLAVRLLLGIMFGSAKIFGGYSPFGAAYVAASGGGFGGVAALLGTVIGAAGTGGFNWALKYAAIGILIYAASAVFRDMAFYDKRWFAPANAAIMTACTGFVYAAHDGWAISATAYYISEVVLAAGCAFFYRGALEPYLSEFPGAAERVRRDNLASREASSQYRVSLMILLATLLVPLSGIRVMGVFAPGGIAAVIVIMTAARKGGMAWGCSTGVILGIAIDAANGGEPFFTAAYALAGLVSGVFHKSSRLSFLTVYTLANTVAVMWNWSSRFREASLYEVFAADVIFMLLPSGLLRSWRERFLPEHIPPSGTGFAARYARSKAENVSQAFREVHNLLRESVEGGRNDNDIISVFDVAADSVCRNCRRAALCWQQNYNDTLTAMNDAAKPISERGELIADDFPMRFRDRCIDLKAFVSAVNAEYRAMMLRRQYRNRLRERQNSLYEQFSDMSKVVENIAESFPLTHDSERAAETEERVNLFLLGAGVEGKCAAFSDRNRRLHIELSGSGVTDFQKRRNWISELAAAAECPLALDRTTADAVCLYESEPLVATIGIASLRKRGEDVSGDNGAFFKTDEGMLYMILSDGMGSGDAAAHDSKTAVRVLERFLRAGVDAETALRILGGIMNLRGDEVIGCATVDLLCVNLFNGDAELYKYGAAPSYIRKGSSVKRVSCETLSAGLAAGIPDRKRLLLEPGAYAVIVSDGVAGFDDDWLSVYLAGYEYDGEDFSKVLAHSIVEIASEKFGRTDDMTALVASINN